MGRSSLLLIEDHKDYREALKAFLELQHVPAHMIEASSGEEGVVLAKKRKPEIAVIDYALEGMNGLEAARQIKKYLPKCNIIMLTIYDPKEISRRDGHGTIRFFISKGNLYDRLVPAIRKILNPTNRRRRV
jgi:DNA-binding NarL/FixJ family response regulator